jgi:flagellin
MQVYNNVPAFAVWKNYTFNVANLRSSMSKLSSGLRINSAGDDPAGLVMSERLRAQYRNTSAAASNVENKINYLQTADSWLQKVHDILGRMAELAIMANDGTKSQTDRDNLQKEFEQMQKEIQRITSGATAAG